MDRGLVTFDQLYWAGQFQVLRIIRSLFEWSKGSFEFQERELPTWVAATPPLDTANLLLEEFRQCPLERLGACALLTPETWIWPSHQEAEAGHALQLNDLEEGVLAWVQEPMSFHAILETGLAEPSQLIRCVQGLLAVGLLDRTAEGDDSLPPMGVLPQDTRGPDLTN